MTVGPFSFFERGHRNGEADKRILLAALHWRWSITWRWLIDWTPWSNTARFAPLTWWIGKNGSGSFTLRLPIVGSFSFAWQRNMPWKPASSDRGAEHG